MKISYHIARMLGSIAEINAMKLSVPVAIALGDREGGILFFGRMDDALPASAEIAKSKAYTSAVLRMATHEVGELAQPGGELYGIQNTHNGKIVLFGGGLPLWLRGRVVGSVGISGGTVQEDLEVAKTVVEALEIMEHWSERIGYSVTAERVEGNWGYRLEEELMRVCNQLNWSITREEYFILVGAICLAAGDRRKV